VKKEGKYSPVDLSDNVFPLEPAKALVEFKIIEAVVVFPQMPEVNLRSNNHVLGFRSILTAFCK
jgi:hypothetical protein